MQRPRRTSEFHDDPGVKRPSRHRNTSPSGGSGMLSTCTSGTAKKYSGRPSRIAIPSRSSSSDRAYSNNIYQSVPPSAVKRGVTPQKTPLPKTNASRVLFTAEKQRTGQGANANPVPLHNDKKWVQEQTQRITDHLLKQSSLGGGINTDFLNRGLKQMSIKQFVAIINYFLGYIWGNRYTVGNNHVEDIINILQKLQYPHPLNKSWLKTPNTQHSFGNVIVLLDFLMDFVPPSETEHANGMYFDLKDPQEIGVSIPSEELFQAPDLEFQQELLENSERGFLLWDKQKTEEFDGLKLHTCNVLIQKICGVADLKSVELEIEKLHNVLKSLENERPLEDRDLLKMKSKLSHEVKNLRHEIKILQDECDGNERDIKELASRKNALAKEVETIEMDIKCLQDKLNTQSCTVEQRDQMIADVMQHKQMLAIKERAVQDIQNRYHNEQILQSKAIKQFNDQIEIFNAHMREIKFSDLMQFDNSLSKENLELSLRPKQTELDKLVPHLQIINDKAVKCLHENNGSIFKMQKRCNRLKDSIDIELYPKLNALRANAASKGTNLQKYAQYVRENECGWLEEMQKIKEEIDAAERSIQELEFTVRNKKTLVAELVQANEETMHHAEQKHHQNLAQRRAYLKAYNEILEESLPGDDLQRLKEQIQLQQMQLDDLKKGF